MKRRWAMTAAAGVAVIAFVISMIYIRPPFVTKLDRGIYDIFLREMAVGEPSSVPILIDIDEHSLDELGQWPWPRYITAEIAAALYEAGVKVVAMDVLMAEPDRTSLNKIAHDLEENFGASLEITGAPSGLLYDNDAYMAMILSHVPSIASVQLDVDPKPTSAELKPFPITELRAPGAMPLADYLPTWEGAILPVEPIASAASYHALMNAEGDDDGQFRRVPLFCSFNGTPVPGLAITALALGAGDKSILVRVGPQGPESIKVAGIDVPISHEGTMPVVFRGGRGTIPTYSAVDVLDRAIDPSLLAGRIAFFGSTASGLLDLRPTPFDNSYPGLELHGAAIDTILSERFLLDPIWALGANVILVALLGAVALAVFAAASPLISFPTLALMVVGAWLSARYMMTVRYIYISPLYTICAITMEAFMSFSMRFLLEERDKRVLRRAFANYVSPEVVGRIVERGGVASLTGETREITVLFTDLRGFTSMTEKMSPTDVSSMLGAYFTPMTHIVRESGGTLDKFVGDALMAFWNAPLDVPDHPAVAVTSLMKMQEALAELNRDIEPRFGTTLRMGGGIHTGTAHVGNMGTSDLMDYTAIGDTVNTASRVEGMCSKYGVGIAVSGDTANRLTDASRFSLVQLDLVRVKGRKEGTPLYTVMSPEEAATREEELARWRRAFALYIEGDFAKSGEICTELARELPGEKRYAMFAERSAHMLRERPAEWNGIFTYESK